MPKIIPNTWLPDANMERIICHWTAGGHRASDVDRSHYHILIEKNGTLVHGFHEIDDNENVSDEDYAAHVKGKNTNSIGITVCGMAGAHESPFDAGPYPMTRVQWEAMAQVAAELCQRYGLAVTPQTVLGHGEVERYLGVDQDDKWDPLKLPWNPGLSKDAVGDQLRALVAQRLATL
jgi:N-acetyl-anhydromuramyl-L-alanine amidase AmpD